MENRAMDQGHMLGEEGKEHIKKGKIWREMVKSMI